MGIVDTEKGKRDHPARGTEHVADLPGPSGCHGSNIDSGLTETQYDRPFVFEQIRGIDIPFSDNPAFERLLSGERRLVLTLRILADCRYHVIELLLLHAGFIRYCSVQARASSTIATTSVFLRTSRPRSSIARSRYFNISTPVGWSAGLNGQGNWLKVYW